MRGDVVMEDVQVINESNSNENTELYFKKLTPIKDADISTYKQALDYIFEEEDLLNVAITGAYSSGKSSVLETYKSKNDKNLKFIHVSLADFEMINESTESNVRKGFSITNSETTLEGKIINQSTTNSETVLEGKIINQLIHQISSEKIPQTHFKIKRNGSIRKTVEIASFLIVWLLSFYLTIFQNNWSKYVSKLQESFIKDILVETQELHFTVTIGIIFLVFTSVAIFYLVKTQIDKNILRKISVKGMEIEVLEDNKDSYFDKYLNEVLYIFENSEAHCIVFEDIDRFDNNRIFTKLREINCLVNRKLASTKIRFLYLLRDEVFVSKDRTKFFDFIIPIVPVVDSSNSLDIFIENFEESGILEEFDSYFLQGMALYIDDMRLLKNICNEYNIYSRRLDNLDLSKNKLLAIMALKNVFPTEFSSLQLGQGYLASVFSNKDLLISDEIAKLKSQIVARKQEIEEIKNESLNSLIELDAMYIEPEHNHYFKHNSNMEFDSRLDMIARLREHPEEFIMCLHNDSYFRNKGNASKVIEDLESNEDYLNRKKLIASKKDTTINKKLVEIKNIEEKILDVNRKKLHQILNKDNVDSYLMSSELRNDHSELLVGEYYPLIKYLIRNGFIDETYPDYMSYFYEKSIKRVDKVFLRSVLDEIPKEFTYHIEEPKKVVDSIQEGYFRKVETLNNDILDYLLCNWSNKSELLIKQIISENKVNFLWQFFNATKNKSKFVKRLYSSSSKVIERLAQDDNVDIFDRDNFMLEVIYTLKTEELQDANEHNGLTDYLSENYGIYSKEQKNLEVFIEKLKCLDVKVKVIDVDEFNVDILSGLYSNNMYELSISNIEVWLKHMCGLSSIDNSKLTSLIFNEKAQSVKQYVLDNITEYLVMVMELDLKVFYDDINTIISIMNNVDIENELKLSFYSLQAKKILKLNSIVETDLWTWIVRNNKVEISCENIIHYFVYMEKEITNEIVSLINKSDEDVSCLYAYIEKNFDKSIASAFFRNVMQENSFNDDKYRMILNGFGHYIKDFSYEGIENTKIMILIDTEIVKVNEESIQFMREEYNDVFDYYIASNINKYLGLIVDEDILNDELYQVIESEYIDEDSKLTLLGYSDEPLSISGKKITNGVLSYILENRFDDVDLEHILVNWNTFDSKISIIIEEIASEHRNTIISEEFKLNPQFVVNVLKKYEFEKNDLREFILLCIEEANRNQAIELFTLANEEKILSIFNLKQPNIPKSDFSYEVLKHFKRKGWITKYMDSNQKDGCYKVYTKRKLAKLLTD
jgi:hypothetical protein